MLKKFKKLLRDEKGFTMIELMIVVIIIGVLAAIAIPVYSNAAQESKISRAKGDLRTLESAIVIYHAENNKYPDEGNLESALVPDYIKAMPKDPWDNEDYEYEVNATENEFEVYLVGNETNGFEGKKLYSYGFENDD
jgi:general secretion pathway protein G